MPYYAVRKGSTIGIFTNWNECSQSVKGFPGAKFKRFETKREAEEFIGMQEDVPKKQKHPKMIFDHVDYYVYTDGACSNNGKLDSKSGFGIYFGDADPRNVSSIIEGKHTNNIAELTAILNTYPIISSDIKANKQIVIVTDSEYAIKCVTTMGDRCESEGWVKEIPNKELVKSVYNTYKNVDNVKFMYTKAHTNEGDLHSLGNSGADKLANEAIGLTSCPYKIVKRIYLNVQYSQKDHIKILGGCWDPTKKLWFIYENNPHKNDIISIFEVVH